MDRLTALTEATKTLLSLWHSEDWPTVIDEKAKELDAPCKYDDFDGECGGCPIERECRLVFELGEALYDPWRRRFRWS